MRRLTQGVVMILLSALIAAILPAGYFLFDFLVLHAPLAEARSSFLIGFGLLFVVTLGQMVYAAVKK
ncbi:hypothetical protein [Lacticaseibacillus manihotivorans]|nr:hypothetical protein [Lacticaseibacillus manihotivorans]QFQ90331.1 hypothetical protein LM010_02235 [Lacticaseibacillus manihotivorans]